MNVSVEYEESGFIAGFKTAIALLSGKEEDLPAPTQIPPQKENTLQHEALNRPQNDSNKSTGMEKYITTIQIGKMFGISNAKILYKIDRYILPICNEEDAKCFRVDYLKNPYQRTMRIYKLNCKGCLLFINYMDFWKKFVSAKEGIPKLKGVMAETFCDYHVA